MAPDCKWLVYVSLQVLCPPDLCVPCLCYLQVAVRVCYTQPFPLPRCSNWKRLNLSISGGVHFIRLFCQP